MTVNLFMGDCRDVLASLPDRFAHTCVTSPPYFGLRDYGTGQWDGGDPDCAHVRTKRGAASTIDGSGYQSREVYREACGSCGALRSDQQIGLEGSPAEYVAELVKVFREVRRVLRDDGTLWLNLGDSYASDGGVTVPHQGPMFADRAVGQDVVSLSAKSGRKSLGLKTKDLIGIPWMVAFALREDGWYLRQDIIWHKPNPMPESVQDRCTKAHEYLFLLSKSERYYYDLDAIAEPTDRPEGPGNRNHKYATAYDAGDERQRTKSGLAKVGPRETRNKRSVWTVASQPYAGAHFATYPPALIEDCIKAGSPGGGIVLDPFGGAGTTALVAERLGRDSILIELNPKNNTLASDRLAGEASLTSRVAVL